MDDLKDKAIRVLAVLLVEQKQMPWSWAVAPDLRDGGARNLPTNWAVDERIGGMFDKELANTIRAEQERMETSHVPRPPS
jgi:hypothetical protein